MGKDRPVIKARLVARGFEEENLNEIRKDSPTCSKENLRIVLAIISSHQWQASSLDVKSALLQGNQIDRDLYLKPFYYFGTSFLNKANKRTNTNGRLLYVL